MMNLAEYRNKQARLADFLPWVALVGTGIVLNKDGSFQRTARFRGPDLDSAVPAELVAVAGRLNNAFRRLGSGWAIFVEAQRHGAATYPASMFADSASGLVDAERKADFEEAGAHFESSYFLTFLYLPPAEDAARAETWLYEGRDHAGVDAHEVLRGFADRTDRILQLIDAFMPELKEEHYELEEKHRTITLTEEGNEAVESWLSKNGVMTEGGLYDIANISLVHHVNQALRAHVLYKKDVNYIVENGEIEHSLKACVTEDFCVLYGYGAHLDALGSVGAIAFDKTGTLTEGEPRLTDVVAAAEAADHHPDIEFRYGTVAFALTTHAVGQLSDADVDMAHAINAIADDHGIAPIASE